VSHHLAPQELEEPPEEECTRKCGGGHVGEGADWQGWMSSSLMGEMRTVIGGMASSASVQTGSCSYCRKNLGGLHTPKFWRWRVATFNVRDRPCPC
jgi:hypothetical protein